MNEHRVRLHFYGREPSVAILAFAPTVNTVLLRARIDHVGFFATSTSHFWLGDAEGVGDGTTDGTALGFGTGA